MSTDSHHSHTARSAHDTHGSPAEHGSHDAHDAHAGRDAHGSHGSNGSHDAPAAHGSNGSHDAPAAHGSNAGHSVQHTHAANNSHSAHHPHDAHDSHHPHDAHNTNHAHGTHRTHSLPSANPHCHNEGGPLTRFSVAMPEELLMRFDELVARRGIAKNRSEMVRDLVREALIREEAGVVGTEIMGTLTIVFNHHSSDIQETLHRIQHAHVGLIVSTTHVHLDEHNCLEVIILRGETTEVHAIADQILGTKGVKNGGLVVTTTGQMI